jgi:hypothetical protein
MKRKMNVFFIIIFTITNCNFPKNIEKKEIKQDICKVLKSIKFSEFYGKPIGNLLDNNTIKHFVSSESYLTEPSACLRYIQIYCGDRVYMDIYPKTPLKYNQSCKMPSIWNLDSLRKEEVLWVNILCL